MYLCSPSLTRYSHRGSVQHCGLTVIAIKTMTDYLLRMHERDSDTDYYNRRLKFHNDGAIQLYLSAIFMGASNVSDDGFGQVVN